VAHFDEGRVAVAILPARMEHHFLCVADDPDHDAEARRTVGDRIDGCFLCRQRQQCDDLAEIVAKLAAEILGRHADVTGRQCVTQRQGVLANGLFIHWLSLKTDLGWVENSTAQRCGRSPRRARVTRTTAAGMSGRRLRGAGCEVTRTMSAWRYGTCPIAAGPGTNVPSLPGNLAGADQPRSAMATTDPVEPTDVMDILADEYDVARQYIVAIVARDRRAALDVGYAQ
jgi:hypothetical protein